MRKARPSRLPARLDPEVLSDITKEWVAQSGAKVRERRQMLQMHTRQLADLAGTTEPTIMRIEAGTLNPRDHLRIAIADALRCEVAELWSYPTHAHVNARAAAVA